MKANSWLYHYYMVQSRLQYSLAYGGQSPTTALAAAFYPGAAAAPGMSPYSPTSATAASYQAAVAADSAAVSSAFHSSAAFLSSAYSAASYGYTPPPGAYQLPGEN